MRMCGIYLSVPDLFHLMPSRLIQVLLAIFISSSEKELFRSFTHFYIVIFLWLSYVSFLYILDINIL